MVKVDLVKKIPKAFLGAVIGLTFGGIGGAIFGDMGFVSSLAWEEIFIFLGALFGFIVGWTDE